MPKAFVTGGGRGIGLAIAKKLAEEGYSVTITGRDQSRLAESVKLLATGHGQSHGFVVADYSDLSKEIEIDEDADVLINNAGVAYLDEYTSFSQSKILEIINTNFVSVCLISQKFIANLVKRGKPGNIVNVSSIAAVKGFSHGVIYSGTKGAMNSITRSLASEYGPKGIRVNAVAPAFTDTDMAEGLIHYTKNYPINPGQFLPVTSVSDATWSLLTNPSITGIVLTVDCGATL